MIVHKQTDVDPAMKSALKNHIMRKRQQLKQELEQDAIEKRLKREQEAKRKQDAMTLDQLKEQLGHLEKTLDNLKNEKHTLFLQLKQNMRVLNEDDKQRKQKEEEMSANKLQQNSEQNNKQPSHIQHLQPSHALTTQSNNLALNQQPSTSSEQNQPHLPNQENHAPAHKDRISLESNCSNPPPFLHQQQHQPQPPPLQQQSQPQQQHHQQTTQPSQPMPQQTNHLDQDSMPPNSHQSQQQQPAHSQWPNSVYSQSAAISQLLNGKGPRKPSAALLAQISQSIPFNHPMNFYPQLGHNQNPVSLMSGPGVPTSLAHAPQSSPMVRPSPPPPPIQISSSPAQMNPGGHKLTNMPNSSSGPVNFISNMANSSALNNSVAASAAALGLSYTGSPMSMFNPGSISTPIEAHLALERHAALNAAAAASALNNSSVNNPGGPGGNNSNGNNNSSRNTLLQSMKRPISATNLTSDAASPNKKLHNQGPGQNQPHQIPSSLSNPYLNYPGLPPGIGGPGSVGNPALQASMYNQSLIRTPPPQNMSSLFNSAAFSHLLNAQNFPRQSPYLPQLPQLPQANRSSLPFGHHPLGPYPHLGHHPGIPTSLSHASQGNPMIRPSPPPPLHISNNVGQMNPGGHKLPNLPITSAGPMDFNPNLSTSTAHQMQQQALSNSAVAAAAALGIPFGPQYFNRYP